MATLPRLLFSCSRKLQSPGKMRMAIQVMLFVMNAASAYQIRAGRFGSFSIRVLTIISRSLHFLITNLVDWTPDGVSMSGWPRKRFTMIWCRFSFSLSPSPSPSLPHSPPPPTLLSRAPPSESAWRNARNLGSVRRRLRLQDEECLAEVCPSTRCPQGL